MKDMRETITDVIKHTSLGFVNIVKITGAADKTVIETTATDNSVVIKGSLHDPLPDMRGIFGFNNLGLLKNLIDFPNYKADDAKLTIKYRDSGGEKVAEELVFKDEQGSQDHYRLMAKEAIPDQVELNIQKWDVEIAPTKSIVKEFIQRASMYSGLVSHFSIGTVDGDLIIYFGDQSGSTHKGSMVFEKGVTGEITNGKFKWPISQVLQVLKLTDGVDCIISITNRGGFQITIESNIAEYRYIFPSIVEDKKD